MVREVKGIKEGSVRRVKAGARLRLVLTFVLKLTSRLDAHGRWGGGAYARTFVFL